MKTTEQDNIIMSSKDENTEMVQIEIDNESYEDTIKAKQTETATAANTAVCSDDEGDANANGSDAEEKRDQSWCRAFLSRLTAFYFAYDFPINILCGIGIAKAYPPLGAEYLAPQITASWIATGLIFFLSGLGLKTGELFKVVVGRFFFNAFVEGFNFGVVSLIVFGVSRALASAGIIEQPLADGLAIASCLPMSINAVIILTNQAHGDEAAAIFHATFGNVCGIFLSPFLIVTYLPNATANVDLPKVFLDLTLKVIIPLVCGQIVHITVKSARDFYFAHKQFFKKVQETSLVYIV